MRNCLFCVLSEPKWKWPIEKKLLLFFCFYSLFAEWEKNVKFLLWSQKPDMLASQMLLQLLYSKMPFILRLETSLQSRKMYQYFMIVIKLRWQTVLARAGSWSTSSPLGARSRGILIYLQPYLPASEFLSTTLSFHPPTVHQCRSPRSTRVVTATVFRFSRGYGAPQIVVCLYSQEYLLKVQKKHKWVWWLVEEDAVCLRKRICL